MRGGGDFAGAARLYEQAGRLEESARLFRASGDHGNAARCLRRHLGAEASESHLLAECLRRAGALEELVRLCADAIDRRGRDTRAAGHLRSLLEAADVVLPSELAEVARSSLDALAARVRRAFEGRAQAWVHRARAEVANRYATTWGLDLGTTTCSAAIYDAQTRKAVLCPWKGREQFASTLGLDEQGNELVGLAGEEMFGRGIVGHISAFERKMGTRRQYRIRDHSYGPEELAARLIRHARGPVEGFLAGRVRERVAELARLESNDIPDDWLHWLEQNHDLRLERSRVVVTIPGYFLNNQKHATRHACEIAGVEVVRMLHEPTAACISVARERRLTGRVAVVDLGAGTLDVSSLDVEEGIYAVMQVLGDNEYGGKDFDATVVRALTDRLRSERGFEVPESGLARRRLEVAAEYLEIELSSRERADFSLRAFADDADVRLEMTGDELDQILADSMRKLDRTCLEFRASLKAPPQHLVLVGGPMLSPSVSRRVEAVFGLKRSSSTRSSRKSSCST